MKDYTKDFKVLADYCYTQETNRIYADSIVWNENIMFATCGMSLLWQETEEKNPEGFTVFTVNKGKFTKEEDKDKVKKLKDAGLEKRVFETFSKYDSSFVMVWDKDIPLPSKLTSSKKNRKNDSVTFNLKDNELIIDFDKYQEETHVKATYGDFFSDIQGNIPDDFSLQLWIVYNMLKTSKEKTIHFDYGSLTNFMGKQGYIKMTAGKWNCISTVIKETE